jgi:hypothetical protein
VRSFLAALIALAQLAGPVLAQKQSEPQRAAIAAFNEGDRLSAAGRWSEACAQYTESQRLDPQLGALLHVADCNERIGKLATAWNAFREASRLAEERGDERAEIARERTAALASRVAQLSIRATDPDGLEVTLDGTAVSVGASGTSVAVDAGEHTLHAQAPGMQPWTRTLRVSDGSVESVQVPRLRAANDFGAAGATDKGMSESVATDSAASPGATQRTLGWIALGTGAASGIATGVLLALQNDKADAVEQLVEKYKGKGCPDCVDSLEQLDEYNAMEQPLVEDQRRLSAISIATGVAGGVLVAVGITLLLTAPDDDEQPQVTLVPAIGQRAQLVVLNGRF